MKNINQIIKNIIFLIGSFKVIRLLMRRYKGKASILCYHRVVSDNIFISEDGPQKNLLISKVNFENHMEYISKTYSLVSMDDLVLHLKSKSREFKVAITFDDGYKDNLTNALPILEKYNIPAIIYVCTRFLDNDCKMWWYQLWDHISNNNEINFSWQSSNFSFNVTTSNRKHKIYNYLSELIKPLNYQDQNKLLKAICNERLMDYKFLCLTWEDVIQLSRNPLITIGCHTHTHSSLKNMAIEEAYFELSESKKIIEDKINNKVSHLAFPFGSKDDVSSDLNILAKECGFESAVETTVKTLDDGEHLFSLPRLTTYNSDWKKIRSKLSGLDNFIFSKKI